MAIPRQQIDHNSEAYIKKNPIRSSIGSLGYGTVSTINLAVDTVDVCRDVVKLARLSLKESLIEAETEAMLVELEQFDRIEELKAQLAEKRAKLA